MQESITTRAAPMAVIYEMQQTGGLTLTITPSTVDQYQFNRAWKAFDVDFLPSTYDMQEKLTHTSSWSNALRTHPEHCKDDSPQSTLKLVKSSWNILAAPVWISKRYKSIGTIPRIHLPRQGPTVALLSLMREIPLQKLS